MSGLTDILKARIEQDGPISLHDYMQEALCHPEFGYYATRNPFGKEGDFVTAPEVSQMFGELIGLWCVDSWVKLGAPPHFHLVELGSGNGTLMADALRSAKLVPEFIAAAQIHLVENSARLREIQAEKLAGANAMWHENFPRLDDAPLVVIANEFFDALPIHQYEFGGVSWAERYVGWADGCFQYTSSKLLNEHPALPENAQKGDIFEYAPLAETITNIVSCALIGNGGVALIIDYGAADTILGDSFQALRLQGYVDPFATPGESDLTAHVKFQTLKEIAGSFGVTVHGPTSQGRFLEKLGIEARAGLLARNATDVQKEDIGASLRRLTSADEMGTLFKAMALSHNITAPPEGFGD